MLQFSSNRRPRKSLRNVVGPAKFCSVRERGRVRVFAYPILTTQRVCWVGASCEYVRVCVYACVCRIRMYLREN